MFERTLIRTIERVNRNFRVLLLTGPRQVGKTTLLGMCAEKGMNYVSLDDLRVRKEAQEDPAYFIESRGTPLIIDEVQYAPDLFIYIKIAVDRAQRKGMYWLTGSQQYHLMQGITESLAGRVGIIDMLGLSQAEIDGQPHRSAPFMPTPEWIGQAREAVRTPLPPDRIYERIWQGSFPEVVGMSAKDRDAYYSSYVQTYVQRDIRDYLNVADITTYHTFLAAVAARTGQLLNYSDLSRDVGIDSKTAKSWLSAMEATGLVYLLRPYWRNMTKRLVTKAPKLYFLDTGLCSHLTRWPDPATLETGAMTGAILETHIFSEILKSHWHNGRQPYFYYYRDTNQNEIDLVFESGDHLHPVEFKKTGSPSKSDTNHFHLLGKLGKKVGHGAVVCFVPEDVPLAREVTAVPVGYI